MKITKLDHLILYTANIEACVRFYKMLGFVLVDEKSRVRLTNGEFSLHIHLKSAPGDLHPEKPASGCMEICLELDEGLEPLRAYLEQQGLQIAGEILPHTGHRGPMRSFFLRDPDGNLVEIADYTD